ncbi:MAG: endolytic transglycosylase MltG [Spirochaetes bacterium]|nr:endolytic transglycosylase MltG [Spirochaetota bacterium]
MKTVKITINTLNLRKIIFSAAILIIISLIAVSAVFIYYNSAPDSQKTMNITIEKGSTLRSTATFLEENNLIRNKTFFILLGYAADKKTILAGRFRIFENSSSLSILKRLTTGMVITQKVTIPEGYNMYQIAESLENENICMAQDFLHYAKDKSFMETLGIDSGTAEGYLFPDTYIFAEGSDPRDVISYMKKKMDDVLKEIRARSPETDYSVQQMLTIASIIEKEAVKKEERPMISAAFHNRLKKGMRFDSCATVWYAIGKYDGGHLTKSDLNVDSPFNTYKHSGFPPTPIASPGKSSIEAAFNPVAVPYVFFVARNDGSHYFSITLSRHNQAVAYYQKGERNGFIDDQK